MPNSPCESSSNCSAGLYFSAISIVATFVVLMFGAASARPLGAKLTERALAATRRADGSPAGQANSTHSGISGQIVDSATGAPISDGEVIVALEQPDGTGTDVVFTQANADASGDFSFGLLPVGSPFDVVAVAMNNRGVAYNATVIVGVPVGTNLGAIPLIHEKGTSSGPARIEGVVTATSGSSPSSVRATISAIQTITLEGGISLAIEVPQTVTVSSSNTRPVTIPGERGTSADIFVRSRSGCPAASPQNANCGKYILVLPPSNPSVAYFSEGKISYAPPAAGPVLYSVRASAFMPWGGGASVCMPSFRSTSADAAANALKVAPGATVTSQPINFTGCW